MLKHQRRATSKEVKKKCIKFDYSSTPVKTKKIQIFDHTRDTSLQFNLEIQSKQNISFIANKRQNLKQIQKITNNHQFLDNGSVFESKNANFRSQQKNQVSSAQSKKSQKQYSLTIAPIEQTSHILNSGCKLFKSSKSLTSTTRAIVISWLSLYCREISLPLSALHLSICYLDRYTQSHSIAKEDYQLYAFVCICIAAKHEGGSPGLRAMVQGMKGINSSIRQSNSLSSEDSFNLERVISIEMDILKSLRFKLKRTTLFEYLEIILNLLTQFLKKWPSPFFPAPCELIHSSVELNRLSVGLLMLFPQIYCSQPKSLKENEINLLHWDMIQSLSIALLYAVLRPRALQARMLFHSHFKQFLKIVPSSNINLDKLQPIISQIEHLRSVCQCDQQQIQQRIKETVIKML